MNHLKIIVIILLISLSGLHSIIIAKDKKSRKTIINMDITEAIELIEDQKYKDMLEQHMNEYKDCQISVIEKDDHFETIVSHPPTETATGGTEQYIIDKKTGKVSMGWHEHPMDINNIQTEEIDQ